MAHTPHTTPQATALRTRQRQEHAHATHGRCTQGAGPTPARRLGGRAAKPVSSRRQRSKWQAMRRSGRQAKLAALGVGGCGLGGGGGGASGGRSSVAASRGFCRGGVGLRSCGAAAATRSSRVGDTGGTAPTAAPGARRRPQEMRAASAAGPVEGGAQRGGAREAAALSGGGLPRGYGFRAYLAWSVEGRRTGAGGSCTRPGQRDAPLRVDSSLGAGRGVAQRARQRGGPRIGAASAGRAIPIREAAAAKAAGGAAARAAGRLLGSC